jgi:hypothetical protein
MRSDALRLIETAVLDPLRAWELTLLDLEQAGPEDVTREVLRRHWTRWLLEEPEAARLMGLWGLIDLVASMVDDARDATPYPVSRFPGNLPWCIMISFRTRPTTQRVPWDAQGVRLCHRRVHGSAGSENDHTLLHQRADRKRRISHSAPRKKA